EGIYGNVVVVIGCELNDPDDKNHYLAFKIDKEIPEGLHAEEYVRLVKEAGGFGIIAHPAEKRSYSEKYPPYPWTDWNVDGFDGIEIWNQLSEWMEGISRLNFLYRLLHPLRSIHFPVKETLARWDEYNLKKRIVGTGGIDAHAFKKKFLGFITLEIYPYKVQFKSIRTHLLLKQPLDKSIKSKNFKHAEELIFDSIENGRMFIGNYSVGDAKGFDFFARSTQKIFPMGSRIKKQNVSFCIHAPLKGSIRLIHNGNIVARTRGRDMQFDAESPGVYRVEIFRKHRGWIYSNPITIEE
ncbi:histidinol-phosphatase, partial [bacterium]|nr:histidinol-phosphatase [bacterium]